MKLFIKSACILLALTAIGKLGMVLGETRSLAQMDPLLGPLTNRQVLFMAAAAELGIVAMIWRPGPERIRLGLLAWISTAFLAYRLGLWWIGYQAPCDCPGVLKHITGFAPETADAIMKGILGFLLAGSYFGLTKTLFLNRHSSAGPVEGWLKWKKENATIVSEFSSKCPK
jgi:hypothetical protein